MADRMDDDTDSTTTDEAPTGALEQPAGEPAPGAVIEDGPVEETVDEATPDEETFVEETEETEEADGEAESAAAVTEPVTEPATEPATPEVPSADPEPEPEHDLPRFGAQFSSPEPTTVTARPRRRATRPSLPADPDSVPPAPVAPPVPAFVTFVAPEPDAAAPAPRRRSRRPAESPVEPDEAPAAEDREPEQPRRSRRRARVEDVPVAEPAEADELGTDLEDADERDVEDAEDRDADEGAGSGSRRRRRGRRGRGRGRTGEDAGEGDEDGDAPATGSADEDDDRDATDAEGDDDTDDESAEAGTGSSTRRRRRRRRRGTSTDAAAEDDTDDDDRPERAGRNGRTSSDDDVRGVTGSTRLEAKRQRRREGRDGGRRRAPILSESEFLARREAVDRAMVIRQQGERTQIAVLEDDVLVEHYVTQAQATSFAGNVYLGRVQNVLPSMEAAFIDIGKGRNAVLYAGEVNWDAAGLTGKSRSIEQALKSGDKVLVQVTKDPIGHKGARLTQQVNLPGRFLVYVPGGSMTGISRKLPDKERTRLKDILKKIVPEDAGVIIRTAAEGASEEELTRDVARLQAQWEVIQTKAASTSNAPTLLYGEPDLAIRVIRDVFNEDFKRLVVQGDDAWDTVEAYVAHVSPELSERLQRYTGTGDVFRDLRVDEQLAKALDRKVWLPSGGSLVIDRTEAMTVVDVNTGKFVGSGGNLEQTVTRNNIEAAEEIVRQLRLRDIGGIIVIDFIDMVLESNRDLVLRRLTECLGRDRTKHQVAEVTSLGLVQMTRKRVGQGLLEVFSEPCEHCRGRGVVVHTEPVDEKRRGGNGNGGGNGSGGGNGGRRDQSRGDNGNGSGGGRGEQSRKEADATPQPAAEETGAEPVTAEAGESGGEGRGGRRRGRRGRGQSGEARAAEDAAVLAVARGEGTTEEPEDVVESAEEPEAGSEAPAEQPTPDTVLAAEQAAVPVDAASTADVRQPEPPVAVVAAGPVTVVPPLPATEPVAEEPVEPAEAVAEEPVEPQPELQAEAESEPEPQPEPVVAVARPRRRRAASRPAGPPAS